MKTSLSPEVVFDLRQALHVAVLDALVSSRRWEPGDLVFQGGTSLHLAHGSPRFSEDLDFLVNSSLQLNSISASIKARLEGTAWLPAGAVLDVKKAKDGRNPHAFIVSIGGQQIVGGVRVKVELWQTSAQALATIKAVVAPVRLTRGRAAGMQAFVPTAALAEIYADKVFALVARRYLKPRDVFDLHWLSANHKQSECSTKDMEVRLATYPNESAHGWLEKAAARRELILASEDAIRDNLKLWLPSAWVLDKSSVASMVQQAVNALDQGVEVMRGLEKTNDDEGPSP